MPGTNGKMHELTAALGLCNLRNLSTVITRRKELFNRYRNNLKDIAGIIFRKDNLDVEYNYIYFYIYVQENRYGINAESLVNKLNENGVHAKKSFPMLISDMELYRNCKKGDLFRARDFWDNTVMLPLHAQLNDRDVDYICELIIKNKG